MYQTIRRRKMTEMAYKDAFNILKRNVDILRKDEGEDIDSLVEIMKTSTEAYKLCMERINSVKSAIEQYSTQTTMESNSTELFSSEPTTPSTQRSATSKDFNFDDDSDIPF